MSKYLFFSFMFFSFSSLAANQQVVIRLNYNVTSDNPAYSRENGESALRLKVYNILWKKCQNEYKGGMNIKDMSYTVFENGQTLNKEPVYILTAKSITGLCKFSG